MNNKELAELLLLDSNICKENNIPNSLLPKLDKIILDNYKQISEEVFGIYKKFQPMKQNSPDSMKIMLFHTIKNYAMEEGSKNNFISKLILFRFLLVKSKINAKDYLEIAKTIYQISPNYTEFIDKLVEVYKKNEDNRLLSYIELSDFYKSTGDLKSAIKYYEEYLKIDETKPVIYNITADLYSKVYPYTSLKRQIELYEHSYKLQPESRLALHGLAFTYEKIGNNDKADEYYKKLLENSPTENDYYNYGAFLIHSGDFINGHKYFTHRFNINDVNFKYPIENDINRRWNFKDTIFDKTIIIHYEQGFGDTIMYSRFVPEMKKFTKKIIFIVQDELYDLINNSKIFDNIKVIPNSEKLNYKYDYSIALLDCPHALGISAENIPYTSGYLSVDENKINSYKKSSLDKKLKVGICTSGAPDANYNDRNININKFKFLTEKKNIQLYSLSKNNDENIDGIIPLGRTFNNFTDTAIAIKNMDIIISTDNVILNLSGALGVKTIGLFNQQTNYRWYKTSGKDTGWYKSVLPIQNKHQNDWAESLLKLNDIENF